MNDQSELFLKSSNDIDQEFVFFQANDTNNWDLEEIRNNKIEETNEIDKNIYVIEANYDMIKIDTY